MPSWRLLVTCRDEQVGFNAKPFPLSELSVPEGLMFLVGFLEDALQIDRATPERRGWTADDLEPIVKGTGGYEQHTILYLSYAGSADASRTRRCVRYE